MNEALKQYSLEDLNNLLNTFGAMNAQHSIMYEIPFVNAAGVTETRKLSNTDLKKAISKIEGKTSGLVPQIPGFYPDEMATNLARSIERDHLPRVLFQQVYSALKERLLANAFLRQGIQDFSISPYFDSRNENVMKVSIK